MNDLKQSLVDVPLPGSVLLGAVAGSPEMQHVSVNLPVAHARYVWLRSCHLSEGLI